MGREYGEELTVIELKRMRGYTSVKMLGPTYCDLWPIGAVAVKVWELVALAYYIKNYDDD